MDKTFQVFTDSSLLMELAISAIGLIFMCAFTYAARWLVPKALAHEDSIPQMQGAAIPLDPLDMELPQIPKPALSCKAENSADAVIATD